jgi:hypothetical protein
MPSQHWRHWALPMSGRGELKKNRGIAIDRWLEGCLASIDNTIVGMRQGTKSGLDDADEFVLLIQETT